MGEIPAVILASLGSGAITGAVTVAALRVHIQWLRQVTEQHHESIQHVQEQQRSLSRELERVEGAATRAHQRLDAAN